MFQKSHKLKNTVLVFINKMSERLNVNTNSRPEVDLVDGQYDML